MSELQETKEWVVHCPTYQLARQVVAIGFAHNVISAGILLNTWYQCGAKTCFDMSEGSYCDEKYAKRTNLIIISANDYIAAQGDPNLFLSPTDINRVSTNSSESPKLSPETYFKAGDLVTHKKYPFQIITIVTGKGNPDIDPPKTIFSGTCLRNTSGTLETIIVGKHSSAFIQDYYEKIEGFEVSLKIIKDD